MKIKKYHRTVGVLLSEEMYQLLDKLTCQKEISMSEFIRKCVAEKLQNKEEDKRNA